MTILFGLIALALIIYLVIRNQKDRKEFEKLMNTDYKKTKDEEDELDDQL
jgi:hypothetical protein